MTKIVNQILDKLINTVNDKYYKSKLETELLDPIVSYIGKKLYPVIITITVFLLLMILTMLYTIYMIKRINKI